MPKENLHAHVYPWITTAEIGDELSVHQWVNWLKKTVMYIIAQHSALINHHLLLYESAGHCVKWNKLDTDKCYIISPGHGL